MEKKYKLMIGLIGNPNTGKSTLFNALTGARQHVGNWPGKTVEKKEGYFTHDNKKIKLVDLPGSYSLTAYTEEETITTHFIFEENPDVMVQILDAQNLERNLFITLQLIELRTPLVIALNMVDIAKKEGINIDPKKLSKLLNVPVVIIDAKKKEGIENLKIAILKQAKSKKKSKIKLSYGTELSNEINKIKTFIKKKNLISEHHNLDWAALKILENDWRVDEKISKNKEYNSFKFLVRKSITHIEKVFDKDIHSVLASIKYGFIKGLCKEVITSSTLCKARNISDKIDCLLTNKYLGLPIFISIMWLLFQATFKLSEPLMGLIESLFTLLTGSLTTWFVASQLPNWVSSLVIEGVIGGVGGVLVFVPIIGILFLLISLLEDSGYMARVAYIMDKLMHKIGLHGKAFIPMILGFGCNVPGIMATRTLETKKDRLLTILINPFMSCGARLPVYVLFAGTFFTAYQGWIIFSLYLLGIIIAIIVGFIFKKLFSKNLSSPFVIELPPYRCPSIIGVLMHVWEKVWIFIKKAGTIILTFSVIIWALASFPTHAEYASQESIVGQMGEVISPAFEPLGFGNWQSSVALIFGSVAKEVVVGTFGTLYSIENIESETGGITLNHALQNNFTPLSAYAFMVFVLLYVPCMAVLAVVKKETNSWKWPLFMILYTTGIAWIMAFIVYQGGLLLGFQ